MSSFHFRNALTTDLDSILALERACKTAPHWPAASYASALIATGTGGIQRYLVVAEEIPAGTGPLAGFAVIGLHRIADEITAELEDVIVAPQHRRKGIGHALCTHAIEWAQGNSATSIALEVRAASAGAIALYSALGFRRTGCRPRYYSDPQDDALQMLLTISPQAQSASPA